MVARAGTASVSGPGAVLFLFAVIGAIAGVQSAHAVTLEEARESCRESVGKPIVQSCIREERRRRPRGLPRQGEP